MDELPDEILPIVVGHLPPSGAIQLNNTCKKLHSKLSLTTTFPRRILTNYFRQDPDDEAHYGFQIPVPHQVSCHSMLLSMTWKDQGWGGRVFVLAEAKNRSNDGSGRQFSEGRVVYASGIALHEERRLAIAFQPKKNETYHLWYVVGHGGGNRLRLSNTSIRSLVFDDPSRCFGKASNYLTKTDALPAWDEESGATVPVDTEQFLSTLYLLPPLISFADGENVSEANSQRKLRGFVKSMRLSWIGEFHAYAKAKALSQAGFEWHARPLETMQNDDFLEDRMDFGEFFVPENF